MFDSIRNGVAVMRECVSRLEPQQLTGAAAAELVEILTEAERVCVAARMLAARRVDESKVWQREGHRTAAQWVAAKTGTSLGNAIGVLEMAKRLEDLPETREAFSNGRLSEVQAREISDAAMADPRAERALVQAASAESLGALRERCRKVRAAASSDEQAAYDRIRRGRYLRHWSDHDGAVRLDARLTPDAGAAVIAMIDARRDRIFADARRAGLRESSEAYAADALVELTTAGNTTARSGPRAMVHVVVDHAALANGPGRCEIPGIGPIPRATARALAGDSIVKAVVTRGADIKAVAHLGRTIPARIRTALEIRDPVCVVPGCNIRKALEIDHYRIPFADGGLSRLDNLARLCRWHHYQKTHLGYRLIGEPGKWNWETPDDQDGSAAEARPPPDS
jgi:hypothetical protein